MNTTIKSEAEVLLERGVSEFLAGQIVPAIETFRQSSRLNPRDQTAPANVVFVQDYGDEIGFERHQAIRAHWAERWNTTPQMSHAAKNWDEDRVLTVGYVSGDFCNHSASHCFGVVVNGHDRSRFRVNLYSMTQNPDPVTEAYRAKADIWRDVFHLSDNDMASMIHEDGVDILVDLSGFSGLNRLPVFARKPAPIQVTAWGHGGGTQLKAMDYHFADMTFIPLNQRHLFSERIWDLPCSITYQPPELIPPVLAPPCVKNGYITFGCLNRAQKATPDTLNRWARVLAAVPDSRLLLKSSGWDNPEYRMRVFEALDRYGVRRDRVVFRGTPTPQLMHLQAYSEVDIALDTHPQNGGVTTWEALWMGVPVVAMYGNQPSSRISASVLEAVGLGSLCSMDADGFVATAVDLALNKALLSHWRKGMRGRILCSSAGNPDLYRLAVEEAYRTMWTSKCREAKCGNYTSATEG